MKSCLLLLIRCRNSLCLRVLWCIDEFIIGRVDYPGRQSEAARAFLGEQSGRRFRTRMDLSLENPARRLQGQDRGNRQGSLGKSESLY